jgi:hypothetical protein
LYQRDERVAQLPTYIALDFFGAERPAILGRFKVPLTPGAGSIAF